MSLVIRLTARNDIFGVVLKPVGKLLQFYLDVNQIYVGEVTHCVKSWCNHGIIGTYFSQFILPSETLRTIKFTLLFWGLK